MTASNALRGKPGVRRSTRQKVLETAERLNYRINLTASMLKSGRSNIIHIIVNEFDSPFYSKLVQALADETTKRGFTPFVEQTRYSPDAGKQALASSPFSGQLFDGEIIHASGLGTNLPLAKLNAGRPLVLIDGCEETPSVDTVNFPNEEGARAAVQHLIERGCKHIAIVAGGYAPRSELARTETAYGLRLRGASSALIDAGLAYDESVVLRAFDSENGIVCGRELAEKTQGGIPFDGVFCANDYSAFGVIRGLADCGLRVPDDMKVIGIDGTSFGSYATPTLSTIQVDLNQLAQFSLDMIARRIDERDRGTEQQAPACATIGYRLTERESTRP
jgi:DNA-binding LacI/PurR family transcriptional regulator